MAGSDGRQPLSLREELPGLARLYQRVAGDKPMGDADVRITAAEADRDGVYQRQQEASRMNPSSLPQDSGLRRNIESLHRISDGPTEQRAYLVDPWFWRVVIGLLGTTTLVGLIGIIWLSAAGAQVPDALIAVLGVAVGALAGLFR